MQIEVTREDIEEGPPGFGDSCPVALALQRATGEWAHVRRDAIQIGEIVYDAPVAVSEFVDLFDDELPVEPFAFDINLDAGRPNPACEDEEDYEPE
jgi:hypothetical protein